MRARNLLACMVLLVGSAQAQAPQAQLDSTLQTLAKTKETEANLKKQIEDANRDMAQLRARATGLAERLQISERRVSSQETQLDKVNAELAAKQKEFNARKADYAATVVSLLRMRELPPTAVFSSAENTQDVMRTASLLEKTNSAVAAKAAHLRTDMALLKKLQSTASTRDASTRAEKVTLKTEQEALARELATRQKLQARLNADHASAAEKVAELSRESQSLQELIGKLAANEKATPKPAAPPVKTASIRNFDGKKGSARAPVAGDVLHRFGERLNANSTYHGMVFKARPSATVVAPYDGEVVFTGPFRDYGNMVLIKHKNGYISLIAGLGKLDTGLNQTATRGEPIGTMPAQGNGEAYVELRDADAKPIDPSEWFANVGGTLAR
ncbi:MAG: peptidoglycan DD-metalloendopeptidase family protein [Pseudomonadota bacterium]